MKKIFSIPLMTIFVCLGLFFGYSFMDDPADYNSNVNESTINPENYDFNSGTTATWTTLTASPHAQSRSCLAWVKIGGVDYIYQFGGVSGALLNNVARYNVNTMTWTNNYSSMPQQISAGTAVVMDDSLLYVFGGSSPSLGFTLKYNYITNTWTTMANMPTPVTDAGCVKHGSNVYVVGGGTGLFGTGYFNTVQVYNTLTNTYSAATNYPVAAGMMGIGIQGDTIITAGGWDGAAGIANAYKGIINSGNPALITWTPIANYPGGAVTRMASAPVKLGTGGGVMFAGGAIGGATLTATSYLYNMCTGSWETLPDISLARSNFKGASMNGSQAYICGGFTTVGVGTFERIDFTDITGNCFTGGGSTTLCFTRGGLFKAIPDNGPAGVYDTINVTNNMGTLDDITVSIDSLVHTYIGDIIAQLSHGGQTDTLCSRMGTGTFGNSTSNMIDVRFSDSSSTAISSLSNTTNPSGGTYLPGGRTGVDSLKKHFVRPGGPPTQMQGQWILWVRDAATQDSGQLRRWSICFHSGNITQVFSNGNETPDRYVLSQNYPNPFNPSTKINFSIPKAGFVSLKVYDMLGREVKTLVSEQLSAGEFIADFDGSTLASGTYFYRIQVGDFVEVKKMVLLK